MRSLVKCVLALGALAACSFSALAQDFPSRMVKIIVPVGAGSAVDIYVRALASQLEKQIKQPIVIENLAGAGGIIGTREVLKSAPDGYTLGWASNSYMVHHLTNKEVTYKWPDDFVLVHRGISQLVTVMVNSKVPANTIQELIAYGKANPGVLKVANSGLLTQSQISASRFEKLAGFTAVNVPYKTSPMMTQALISGEASMAVTVPSVGDSGVQTGDIKLLAVATAERTPLLPDLPTFREAGVDMVYGVWQGFVLPKGTPEDLAQWWHEQIATAFQTPELVNIVAQQKAGIETGTRQEMAARIDAEVTDFAQMMKEHNLQAQ